MPVVCEQFKVVYPTCDPTRSGAEQFLATATGGLMAAPLAAAVQAGRENLRGILQANRPSGGLDDPDLCV